MRKFARSHWRVILAILLAIALATLTLETDSAVPAPDLSARLRTHVQAIASEHPPPRDTSPAHRFEQAAGHIEFSLLRHGYQLRRQDAAGSKLRTIEVSVSNLAPGARPQRIFIVGAHLDVRLGALETIGGAGTAAVLELARLLKAMRPNHGTELKFVFFVNGEPPMPGLEQRYRGAGNFIAFAGTLESSAVVRQSLAAFTEHPEHPEQPGFPAGGLAAPAHVMGVTLLEHGACQQHGYPVLMIMDTAFLQYPYYQTLDDTHDRLDYAGMARVVKGLARTIASLAGAVVL